MWFKKAASQRINIIIDNGNLVSLSIDQFNLYIKSHLLKSKLVRKLFHEFDVSLEQLQELKIEICDLDGRYAETDNKCMRLNSSLFRNGRFVQDYMFVVYHEIIHYLTRKKENRAWLNDPEEVWGCIASVGYEIEKGSSIDSIWNTLYPKIKWHFSKDHDAKVFFHRMIQKAQELLSDETVV